MENFCFEYINDAYLHSQFDLLIWKAFPLIKYPRDTPTCNDDCFSPTGVEAGIFGENFTNAMGLSPDTLDCGLRMRWICWKRFPRHRLKGNI